VFYSLAYIVFQFQPVPTNWANIVKALNDGHYAQQHVQTINKNCADILLEKKFPICVVLLEITIIAHTQCYVEIWLQEPYVLATSDVVVDDL